MSSGFGNIYLCQRQLVFVCLLPGWQLIMSHSSATTLWDRELEEHETSIYFNLQLVHCAVSHSQDVGENIRNVWQPVRLPASVPSRQIWICNSSELPELLPTCHTVEEYWLFLSHLRIWNYRMARIKPDSRYSSEHEGNSLYMYGRMFWGHEHCRMLHRSCQALWLWFVIVWLIRVSAKYTTTLKKTSHASGQTWPLLNCCKCQKV